MWPARAGGAPPSSAVLTCAHSDEMVVGHGVAAGRSHGHDVDLLLVRDAGPCRERACEGANLAVSRRNGLASVAAGYRHFVMLHGL